MAPRWWAAASVCLLSCGGGGSQPGYRLDPALASAIPADTVALGGGRWDLLRKSPLYSKIQSKLPMAGMSGMVSQFGIDPDKDLQEFVAAYNGREPLMLARGTFRVKELFEKLVGEGGQQSTYKGKSLVTRGEAGVAALSATVLAAGPAPRLRECIDRLSQSAKLDERWAAGLRALPSQAQIWFLATGGATLNFPRGSNFGNIDKVLASLDTISGWADPSKGLRISINGATKDAASAKQLHTQLRGLIGMGRLATPDNKPELLKLYDAIQTKLDDKKIAVEADLAEAEIDALLKLAGR